MYETLVFIHVVAASLLVGAAALLFLLELRALAAKDPAVAGGRTRSLAEAGNYAGPRLFLPAALALIVFGVWAAVDVDLDFGDNGWLHVGFAVWFIAVFVGTPLHVLNGKAMKTSLEAGHADAARRVLTRETVISGVELALLVFAVWAMVAKP